MTLSQIDNWNGRSGEVWRRYQPVLDTLLRPLGDAVLDAAALAPGERVIDVGCGCGDTALVAAERVGATGRVLAVDVSAPMLARAEERVAERTEGAAAAPIDIVQADASAYGFAVAAFDAIVSRFGVMFFEDPTAAFAHLARALRPGGRLAFVCWRAFADNPWATVPFAAYAKVAEPPPRPGPEEPGPFAFADEARVRRILEGAGFEDVALTPHDRRIPLGPFGEGTTTDDVVDYVHAIGPTSRLLAELDPERAARVRAILREDLGARATSKTDASVWLPSATWIVTARTPASR